MKPSTPHTPRLFGRQWMRIRALILSRNPLCVVCDKAGRQRAATQVDHVIPLSKGGTNELRNLQGLCDECHAIKTALDCDYRVTHGCDGNGLPLDPDHHWNK